MICASLPVMDEAQKASTRCPVFPVLDNRPDRGVRRDPLGLLHVEQPTTDGFCLLVGRRFARDSVDLEEWIGGVEDVPVIVLAGDHLKTAVSERSSDAMQSPGSRVRSPASPADTAAPCQSRFTVVSSCDRSSPAVHPARSTTRDVVTQPISSFAERFMSSPFCLPTGRRQVCWLGP